MAGYNVVTPRGGSVAWTTDKPEADRIARTLNYRGGTLYRVQPASRPLAMLQKPHD